MDNQMKAKDKNVRLEMQGNGCQQYHLTPRMRNGPKPMENTNHDFYDHTTPEQIRFGFKVVSTSEAISQRESGERVKVTCPVIHVYNLNAK